MSAGAAARYTRTAGFSPNWRRLEDEQGPAEGVGVGAGGNGDAASVGEDQLESPLGSAFEARRIRQHGDGEKGGSGNGGRFVGAGKDLGGTGLARPSAEGVQRGAAVLTERDMAQAAGTEVTEAGVPVEMVGGLPRHRERFRHRPLALPGQSSPVVTRSLRRS